MALSQGPSYDEIPQTQVSPESSEWNPSWNVEAQIWELIAKVETPELKALAEAEKAEFIKDSLEVWADSQALLQEFQWDIKALDYIEEKFSKLDNYSEFLTFFTGNDISLEEWELLMQQINNLWLRAKKEFKKNGFPVDRTTFALFADKFDIPISTVSEMKEDYSVSEVLPVIQRINQSLSKIPSWVSNELDVFRNKLTEAESKSDISPQEISELRKDLVNYLTWSDGKGWEIDNIMVSLKKKDTENAAKGIKTTHFETFAQTARDFSPEVSKRISVFMDSADPMPETDPKEIGTSKKILLASWLPKGTDISTNKQGEYVAKTPDGGEVKMKQDWDLITRQIDYDGADYPINTWIETADVSWLIAEREWVKQEFAPKQQACERALLFLENPLNANVPLADMKDGLLKLLWYALFNELWVREASDKNMLISTIKTNAGVYKQKLVEAQKKFEKKAKLAAQKTRERYVQRDEQMKLSLKSIKNSGLWKLGMDFLVSEMKWQIMTINIGDTFDIGNINLASNDFWESLWETNSPTKHIENMYRVANKLLTGSPDGMVDGELVGFDLDPNKLKTGVAQKTETEMMALLKGSWVWSEAAGTNKQAVRKRLADPLPQNS